MFPRGAAAVPLLSKTKQNIRLIEPKVDEGGQILHAAKQTTPLLRRWCVPFLPRKLECLVSQSEVSGEGGFSTNPTSVNSGVTSFSATTSEVNGTRHRRISELGMAVSRTQIRVPLYSCELGWNWVLLSTLLVGMPTSGDVLLETADLGSRIF